MCELLSCISAQTAQARDRIAGDTVNLGQRVQLGRHIEIYIELSQVLAEDSHVA